MSDIFDSMTTKISNKTGRDVLIEKCQEEYDGYDEQIKACLKALKEEDYDTLKGLNFCPAKFGSCFKSSVCGSASSMSYEVCKECWKVACNMEMDESYE